jgi:hypothetical protein
MTETMALHPADCLYAALTAAELDGPLPRTGPAAELEAAWRWTDQLTGYGDLRPDTD